MKVKMNFVCASWREQYLYQKAFFPLLNFSGGWYSTWVYTQTEIEASRALWATKWSPVWLKSLMRAVGLSKVCGGFLGGLRTMHELPRSSRNVHSRAAGGVTKKKRGGSVRWIAAGFDVRSVRSNRLVVDLLGANFVLNGNASTLWRYGAACICLLGLSLVHVCS